MEVERGVRLACSERCQVTGPASLSDASDWPSSGANQVLQLVVVVVAGWGSLGNRHVRCLGP